MKITKHAQSCVLIETKEKRILIDPGSFVFNEEGLKPSDLPKIDLILITHEHSDHFDINNIEEIVKRDNPTVLGQITAIQQLLERMPDADAKPLLDGQSFQFDDVHVFGFHSKHGPLPNGKPAPEVIGIVVDDGENRFYTPGDSLYLNREAKADIIAVPICGVVVMDIEQAKDGLLELKPKLAIPIHYDNPNYPVNPADFERTMKDTGIKVKILKNGESITYGRS